MSPRPIRSSLAALGLLALAAGCHKPESDAAKAPPAPPPAPVAVAVAQKSAVPITIRTIGTVESKARVMLRPQITGRIARLSAAEGTDVAAGQEILAIDAGPFQAALNEAQANLARAKAMADDARHLSERVKEAAASSAVSQREAEEAQSKLDAADADVLANQAKVDTARWNFDYCTVHAPFAGRLGAFMVKPGAIVKTDEADLVEIVQTDPIDVGFSVPEENIPAIRAASASAALPVEAQPSGDTASSAPAPAPARGELTFVDSKVDPMTGTIRLKATFPNQDRRLWPGRYASVIILLGQDIDAVTVPESAVQTSQVGPSVFVIKPDQTSELRSVKVRRTTDGLAVIEQGIAAGETVVTEGQLRLGQGTKVQIKNAPPPATAEATKP